MQERLSCPKCGGKHMFRLERKGFIQTRILPLFGYFPWKCYDCRIYRHMRSRGGDLTSLREHGASR